MRFILKSKVCMIIIKEDDINQRALNINKYLGLLRMLKIWILSFNFCFAWQFFIAHIV